MLLINKFNLFEYLIALGLVLFPIDNYLFSWNSIRLKDIGLGLIICGCIGILLKTKKLKFNNNTGYIYVNIFIIIICLAICIDAIFRQSGLYQFYNIILAVSFGLIYFVSANKDYNITKFFPYAVLIEAVSCIIQGILYINGITDIRTGYFTGGIITSRGADYVINYNLAVGYMAYGLVFSSNKWQRILIPIIVLATFFTGSIEGIYIIGGILLWMVIKKNYNKSMWLSLSGVCIFIVLWFIFGTGAKIWYRIVPGGELVSNTINSHELNWKMQGYKNFFNEFSWIGNGYKQLASSKIYDTVHNVPLVIVQQIGIIPAIAWIGVSIWNVVSVIRNRLDYRITLIWIVIFLMCLFDHMVWTNFAIYWFLAVGISFSCNFKQEVTNE